MMASRRSRGASEMRKEREKREAEKNKKRKKKKETRAPRPHHRQPCRLHPRAKLRFAFGLRVGKRQQYGGGGVGDGGGEDLGVKDWIWKNGRMVEIAGRMLAIKKRKKKVEMMGLDVEVGDV